MQVQASARLDAAKKKVAKGEGKAASGDKAVLKQATKTAKGRGRGRGRGKKAAGAESDPATEPLEATEPDPAEPLEETEPDPEPHEATEPDPAEPKEATEPDPAEPKLAVAPKAKRASRAKKAPHEDGAAAVTLSPTEAANFEIWKEKDSRPAVFTLKCLAKQRTLAGHGDGAPACGYSGASQLQL